MALHVDENGENLDDWQKGQIETLTELVNALGSYWAAGALTLSAAIKVYAQVACMSEDESAEFLTSLWVDNALDEMSFLDDTN
ncbi:hypothetical protein [Streptomyces sp. NPDC047706]|uniref:hypothetical protein n=1 Tax=Streptomyces sp. NPDC047706 TaxID=3365486 RepID=UPI00370FCF13